MDVGVDTHDFRPWHFDEVSSQMAVRTEVARQGNRSDTLEEGRDDPRAS